MRVHGAGLHWPDVLSVIQPTALEKELKTKKHKHGKSVKMIKSLWWQMKMMIISDVF